MPRRITLIHTNDVHNRWSEPFVEQIRAAKQQFNALLFDAGDCIRAGNMGIPLYQESAWAFMRDAGYNAIALGNREFHITPFGLLAKLRGAPCAVLCANLRPKQPDTPLPVQPVWHTEHHGVRVAVIGLTVPMVTPRMKSALLSAYLFDPPIEVAQAWISQLRHEADLLIALTHIGYRQDCLLAEACPQLDLILGGHSHTPIQPPEQRNGVWIAQAPPFGEGFGLITLERTPSGRWQIVSPVG